MGNPTQARSKVNSSKTGDAQIVQEIKCAETQ